MQKPAILFLATLIWNTCCGAVNPDELQCETLKNPQGIDTAQPRLSWILDAGKDRARMTRQSAFRILVASSEKKLSADAGDLWDSGRVGSDQSTLLSYTGQPLKSGQECFWKVMVWDQNGDASRWSAPARWSMGLLDPQDWKGRWIGLDAEAQDSPANPLAAAQWIWSADADSLANLPVGPRYFRRTFTVPAGRTVLRATCRMAADNSYECFLNGKKLGTGSYEQAQSFDFTDQVRAGLNAISVVATNSGDSPNPAGLLASIEVEFGDGPSLAIATDKQWHVAKDAPPRWQETNFADNSWSNAREFGANGIQPWKEIKTEITPRLPARMLRREFTLAAKPKRAMLYASGLGLSEFYLNGEKVGDHVLSPGLTDYSKRVLYVAFDVTKQLVRGRNCIGAWLGNGRFYSPRPSSSKTYGFPKLLLTLRIEDADGRITEVTSDENWRLTTAGPIPANNEYDGEIYDARLEQKGWAAPGFDDRDWQSAQVVTAPGGILSAEMAEPIRITGIRKPIRMTEPRPGTFVYDLGQNLVGWCRIKVRGAAGTEVRLRHAETVQADGTLYLDNLRGAKATDVYTLKGKGTEVWEPRFTYHGFRYVEVQGYPGKPNLDSLEACIVNDDLPSAGAFACSNPLLNRIYSNVVWGVRGNYRSIPTDCPQRDERHGWLGDRSAESKGETFIFDNQALYANWVRIMTDAQRPNGSVPDVCPPYWPRYSDNVTWPSSLVVVPGSLLDQFGDRKVIADAYPTMARWMNHMSGYLTNDLMFRDEYGDWCVPPEDPQLIHSLDPARKTAPGVLGTTYFYHCLKLMAQYAALLGKTNDFRQWDDLSVRVKDAFNQKFFNAQTGYYDNGSQTSCILPLMFGMVPEEHRAALLAHLIAKIRDESHNHVGTGLVGGQWLMRTLTANGYADLAYTLASQKSYPSWGYMVEKDATTLWELWNGDTADPAMNSHNHVMLAGDLVIWLYEDLAGIKSDPMAPGFRHIIMHPHLVGDLDWVRASHRSPYGWIKSEWHRRAKQFTWTVTIPPNTTAELYLPGSNPSRLLEHGKPASQARGILSLESKDGSIVAKVASGTYNFELSN